MRNLSCVVLALLAASPAAAHAEEWVTTVGLRLRVKPPYEGADKYRLGPHPTFTIRRAAHAYRFVPPDGGSTIALIDTDHVVAGPMLRVRYKRSDINEFTGLDPIKLAAEPGVFVDLWPKPWLRTRLELRHGVGGHQGFVGDAGLDFIYHHGRWVASIGPRIGYGDANYMQTYFGVTPLEAARSPLIDRSYHPGGGVRYTGATAAASYRLGKRWRSTIDVSYNRLAGKALDSPVVQTVGAGHQVLVGLGLSYSFGAVR